MDLLTVAPLVLFASRLHLTDQVKHVGQFFQHRGFIQDQRFNSAGQFPDRFGESAWQERCMFRAATAGLNSSPCDVTPT